MKRLNFDHNSTTVLRREVVALLESLQREGLANPSSIHAAGRRARDLVDRSREQVAGVLGVEEGSIVFTSGGTEANNLALFGALAERPGSALVTTAVEHASVLEPAAQLDREGHRIALLPVDAEGQPQLDVLEEELARGDVGLVSIQAANNEIGTLIDLESVGRKIEAAPQVDGQRPIFHTDAAQAVGRVELDLGPVDLATVSAHKFGGPRGIGVLVRKKGASLSPRTHGGSQESGLRPGTEDVAGIAAAALAMALAVDEQPSYLEQTRELTARIWNGLVEQIPGARLHGPPIGSRARLPNTLNVGLPDCDGKILVTRLDLEGLEVSAGSACASGSIEPSHVLIALGLDPEAARAGIRLSIGRETTALECDRAVEILWKIAAPARAT